MSEQADIGLYKARLAQTEEMAAGLKQTIDDLHRLRVEMIGALRAVDDQARDADANGNVVLPSEIFERVVIAIERHDSWGNRDRF